MEVSVAFLKSVSIYIIRNKFVECLLQKKCYFKKNSKSQNINRISLFLFFSMYMFVLQAVNQAI